MKDTDIIDHHQIIRDTVGYEVLNQFPLEDMPRIMEFLKVIYNHQRMNRLNERFGRPGELIEEEILADTTNPKPDRDFMYNWIREKSGKK